MLNIPNTVKALFKRDGVRKNFRVHFPNGEMNDLTNENIVQESVKFTESVCSQDVFKFGLAEASVIEFETVGIANMYGMEIECGMEIDLSSLSAAQLSAIAAGTWDGVYTAVGDSDIGYAYFRVPYGIFKVTSCPRDHGAMTHRKITAYQVDLFRELLPFPTKSLAASISMSLNGIAALKTGGGITEGTAATITTCSIQDPDNNMVITSGCIAASTFLAYSNFFHNFVWLCTGTTDNPVCAINYAQCTEDIILPTGTMDADQLQGLAEVIASSLYDAGVDLTMDGATDGGNHLVQIYSDNLEALKAGTFALSPSIQDEDPQNARYPRTTWDYYVHDIIDKGNKHVAHSYQAQMNVYNPIIGGAVTTTAFYGQNYNTSSSWNPPHKKTIVFPKILPTDNVFLRVTDSMPSSQTIFIKLRYAEDNIDLLPFLTKEMNITSVRQFTVDNPAPHITLQNTGKYGTDYYAYLGGQRNITAVCKNAFEIFARFYKADRFGGGEAILLYNSNPEEISPGEYSEMWWDEYDVEPIGSVTVTYENSSDNSNENTISIPIGSGGSVYNMENNEALQNLSSMTESDLKTLILTDFKPNVGAVHFTPVELTMKGFPWIEAGDALEITAEDGVTVDTYALRIEMNGIQDLQLYVESQGGQIIESEEAK
jgi:hypothetical protein